MSSSLIQPSFAAGEIAPSLWSRVDHAKYHVGAALLRNFFVDYQGGAANRPGTMFVNQVKDSDHNVRVVPFEFSTEQTYVLEFGHLYMRVIMDGAHVLETTTRNITGATKAVSCVITAVAHGYATGDWVYIANVGGMTQLNGKYYIVTVLTANTFSIQNILTGANIDSSAYTVYTAGGTSNRVFTLVTPYDGADIALLKFVQSADVLTVVHEDYTPRNLTRTAHDVWTLTVITFTPTQIAPVVTSTTPSTGGATGYRYVVTAISADGSEESLASNSLVAASVPMSTTAGAYVTVTWTAPAGAQPARYNIYRTDENVGINPPLAGSLFGYVGSTDGTALQFIDQNIQSDMTDAPPTGANPFAGGNNPSCVAYFQGRRVYGGSLDDPQTIWASRSSAFNNMDITYPPKDTDSLTMTILSQQVNAIQHMVPLQVLLVLTRGGAWKISAGGNTNDTLTPDQSSADPQVYNGCNERVVPIVVGHDILYVQHKGALVRNLTYNLYANAFTGIDLTTLANHLFRGYSIFEWAWAEEPFKIVWAVRSDGTLLSFTFLKDQEVMAWARHDSTNGRFLSVASVSEGDEDAVYFVIQRKIQGRFVQYIERMSTRNFGDDPTIPWFVDSGLRYPLTAPAAAAIPSATTTWEDDNVVDGIIRITTDAIVFAAGDVNAEKVVKINGGRMKAYAYVSPTVMDFQVQIPLTDDWYALEGEWAYTTPVMGVTGLDHLEGQTVTILGDGGAFGQRVVTNGAISFGGFRYSDITIGLPIQAQLQTLYLNPLLGGGQTSQGKPMNATAVTVRVVKSRGLKAGSTFSTLVPFKERSQNTPLGVPMPLLTGDVRQPLDPNWKVGPQLCFQQDDPLPCHITGIIPEVALAAN